MDTDLDALSSRELHDLAMHRALRHGDVRFLWDLLRALPAAAELEGDPEEAGRDLTQVHALLSDAIGSGEGAEAEALRPLYLDYLKKHGKLSEHSPAGTTPVRRSGCGRGKADYLGFREGRAQQAVLTGGRSLPRGAGSAPRGPGG